MSDVLRDAIAAGLATLTPVVATPTGSLGFGVCMSVDSDVHLGVTVDPMSTLGIAQALVRRWDCPRGALPPDGKDARSYGVDLRGALNRGQTVDELRALVSSLRVEALKDDRISAITIKATQAESGASYRLDLDVRVTPADPSLSTFSLTLAASSAELVLRAIGGVQ